MIAASVAEGFTTLPSALTFIEHVSLSLLFRAAYKGIGSFSWDDWSITSGGTAEVIPVMETAAEPSITRKAA